eukprot:GHVQ01000288.1.p2 GENE.GHVQ01000288.1~~GHVQ01000288.1.p2  ORF type:complete len:102 (+),score=6.56 GHVQ01000288.1:959-1264(+)
MLCLCAIIYMSPLSSLPLPRASPNYSWCCGHTSVLLSCSNFWLLSDTMVLLERWWKKFETRLTRFQKKQKNRRIRLSSGIANSKGVAGAITYTNSFIYNLP